MATVTVASDEVEKRKRWRKGGRGGRRLESELLWNKRENVSGWPSLRKTYLGPYL